MIVGYCLCSQSWLPWDTLRGRNSIPRDTPVDSKRSTNAPIPRAESMLRRRDERLYLLYAFPRKHFAYVTGPQDPLFSSLKCCRPYSL